MTKEQYIDQVLELHAQGTIDVYYLYRTESGIKRNDQETELQYIIRMASEDYDNTINHELAFYFAEELGLLEYNYD